MSDATKSSSPTAGRSRGSSVRSRGKSRGGFGKYLRARGRGGPGRPAEFGKRLVLEGEETLEGEDAEAEAAEIVQRYSKRRLETNADRYVEPEPELDSDGEIKEEPEVDLSSLLERQRISETPSVIFRPRQTNDEEIDETVTPVLSHITSGSRNINSKKGQVHQIEWDEQLEEMSREKATTDAARDLKSRFRARSAYLGAEPKDPSRSNYRQKRQEKSLVHAPPLIVDPLSQEGTSKEKMQDFLDDLLD